MVVHYISVSLLIGDDPHLKAGVASLSKFLEISQHPDHITTLQVLPHNYFTCFLSYEDSK